MHLLVLILASGLQRSVVLVSLSLPAAVVGHHFAVYQRNKKVFGAQSAYATMSINGSMPVN